MENLGVTCWHNTKAWTTIDIFTEWLKSVNNEMKKQKRKILLLLENCSAPHGVALESVKITSLPPNTTSNHVMQALSRHQSSSTERR